MCHKTIYIYICGIYTMQRYVKLGNHSRSFDVHQNWVTLDEIVKMSCDSRLYIYLVYIYTFFFLWS